MSRLNPGISQMGDEDRIVSGCAVGHLSSIKPTHRRLPLDGFRAWTHANSDKAQ
jgi:hypothetical protein